MAPGLCQLVGGRPKPSPCLKLFSFLYPKTQLPAQIQLNEETIDYVSDDTQDFTDIIHSGKTEEIVKVDVGNETYTLGDLAYARHVKFVIIDPTT